MFKKRIESVISFVNEENICRSRQLIGYFGQQADNDCGVCDVCLGKKNSANPALARENVKKEILDHFASRQINPNIIKERPADMQALLSEIQTIAGDNYRLYLDVLREMMDSKPSI